jgi:hypothetical protein
MQRLNNAALSSGLRNKDKVDPLAIAQLSDTACQDIAHPPWALAYPLHVYRFARAVKIGIAGDNQQLFEYR